ncbi:MAG: hypothetical protein M3O46_05695 [Myxococcota bacterium]|nr:hypothetical protein [Myxococcota bacterium]
MSGEERAEIYALAAQEREDETGELLAAKKKREAEEARQGHPRNGETVKLWSGRWCKARRARGLRSVDTDGHRLTAHVLPRLGARPMRDVNRAELEEFVACLDERVRAWRSRSRGRRHHMCGGS